MAVSVEQVIKTFLTIFIVEFISRKTNFDTENMAKGAMIAASLATICGFIYVFIKYMILEKKSRSEVLLSVSNFQKSAWKIFKEILKLAIPLSIASFVMILGKNIDSITIMRLLKEKVGEDLAKEKYGILSSKVELLAGFPLSINGAVAVNLIPEISKLNVLNKKKELNEKVNFSLFITIFLAVPIMIGMFLYSNEVINLLYPNANKGGELLKLASISIIFCTLTQTMTGILQGIGEVNSYLKIISFSMILKLVLNLVLIPVNNLLEKGAIISSLTYDIVVFCLVYRKMQNKLNLKLEIFSDILKVSLLTFAAIFLAKIFIRNFYLAERLKTILEISLIVIIYFLLSILILKIKKILENKLKKTLKNQEI